MTVRIGMPSEEREAVARKELVKVANAMLDGTFHLLEGARKINGLRFRINDPENKIFNLFVAVDSETDHQPLGPMRALCALEFLRRADEEMEHYLADTRDSILRACRELIQAYSEPISDPTE